MNSILIRLTAICLVLIGFIALGYYISDYSEVYLYREDAKILQGKVIAHTLSPLDTTTFMIKVEITKDDVYISKGTVLELVALPLKYYPYYPIGEGINVAYDPISPLFFYAYDTLPSSKGKPSTYWWVFILLGILVWATQLINFKKNK